MADLLDKFQLKALQSSVCGPHIPTTYKHFVKECVSVSVCVCVYVYVYVCVSAF